MNTSVKPQSLSRTVALKLTNGGIIFAFGSALTLYVTAFPYWERDAAVTWLAVVLTFVVAPLALWWRSRNMDALAVRRMILAYVGLPLAVVCAYGIAAAFGVAPAAPWSPLGQ